MPSISRPNKPLAKVNIYDAQKDGSRDVEVCFLPDPGVLVGEGNSKAVLGLDASRSMKKMYGGNQGPFDTGGAPNYVQGVARKLGDILCNVSKTGKVTGFYWAMNPPGDATQIFGEYDPSGWASVNVVGPKKLIEWGAGTKLLPAIRIVCEQVHKDSEWTMGVIITDGIIEDEADCIAYCIKLGKGLAAGKTKPIKLVLIGVGEEVDEGQLERFDDMFEETDLKGQVDLWSTGLVASMQDESDILGVLYGELMDENTTIAPSGRVEGGSGCELKSWTDGLPGKFRFTMPKGETSFVIHAGGKAVEQDCSEIIK